MKDNRWFVLLFLLALPSAGWSQITFTIDTFTTDRLEITLSGTLTADTVGDFSGWFGIKYDWVNNLGVHTDFFSTRPSIESNSVRVGGLLAGADADNGGESDNDSIYWANPLGYTTSIPAGTEISGSIALTGTNVFDPSTGSALHLVSGVNSSPYDWVRLEAVGSVVPEPAAFAAFTAVFCFVLIIRSRRAGYPVG